MGWLIFILMFKLSSIFMRFRLFLMMVMCSGVIYLGLVFCLLGFVLYCNRCFIIVLFLWFMDLCNGLNLWFVVLLMLSFFKISLDMNFFLFIFVRVKIVMKGLELVCSFVFISRCFFFSLFLKMIYIFFKFKIFVRLYEVVLYIFLLILVLWFNKMWIILGLFCRVVWNNGFFFMGYRYLGWWLSWKLCFKSSFKEFILFKRIKMILMNIY